MILETILKEKLSELGLNSNDTVMIHGDSVAFNFVKNDITQSKGVTFIKQLLDYFSDGTILVPTFSYSATKNKIFDVNQTPGEVGLFSEQFRLYPGAKRTSHPIFSFAVFGKNAKTFLAASNSDCFGKNSVFDIFHKMNGQIICVGCSLDRVTFVHYVEQSFGVSYRHFKDFKSSIREEDATRTEVIRYFVRNLDIDSQVDLTKLKKCAFKQKKLKSAAFGRVGITSLKAKDFFGIAEGLLHIDEFALIRAASADA